MDQNYRAHIIVNPTLPLLANSIYSLQIAAGAVTDLAGNAYAAIQDTPEAQFYILPNIKPIELNGVAYSSVSTSVLHPANSTITLTFSENIKVGTGQITFSDAQGDIRKIDINDSSQVTLDTDMLIIKPIQNLLNNNPHYSVQLDAGVILGDTGNTFAGISNNTSIQFDTAGKPPSPAALNPVQEINHGGLLGIYDNNDVLVFNFDTAVTWNGGFKLAQHSFGGHDVVISADGMSASVDLNELSTVTTGDLLTLTGLSDVYGNAGAVLFTL
ncbi:MAG: Ig-like domain-containing protein [Methylococcales bacterium]|nr:Ig-like domain-containing protein [Methylococcales bacterium]